MQTDCVFYFVNSSACHSPKSTLDYILQDIEAGIFPDCKFGRCAIEPAIIDHLNGAAIYNLEINKKYRITGSLCEYLEISEWSCQKYGLEFNIVVVVCSLDKIAIAKIHHQMGNYFDYFKKYNCEFVKLHCANPRQKNILEFIR